MTPDAKVQYRKNRLLTTVLGAESSISHLRDTLAELEGDIDPREFRAASRSLKQAESALATIRQISERAGAER